MKPGNKLVKVFSGDETMVLLLKDRLEQAGIPALIKNDSHDAFLQAAPAVIDLYIEESLIEKAGPIIAASK